MSSGVEAADYGCRLGEETPPPYVEAEKWDKPYKAEKEPRLLRVAEVFGIARLFNQRSSQIFSKLRAKSQNLNPNPSRNTLSHE